MTRRDAIHSTALIALLASLAAPLAAQDRADVQIKAVKAADNVYMLVGQGGNIGLSIGDDGAILIDDQFAPLTDKILAAVRKLTDQPVRFVINTHWHGDHVGGNENLGKAGAVIVAHENVRRRMTEGMISKVFNRTIPPAAPGALPVITFADSVKFHWNGDELDVQHVEPAHTDGDSIIHFKKANVIHAGDTFFNGMYPFIDTQSGGSIDGMIAAADRVLKMADKDTKIIPGHGPLAGVKELRAFRKMLKTAADRIRKLVKGGTSRDDVIAAKPTKDLDAKWGGGFMKPDQWVGIVFDGMKKPS